MVTRLAARKPGGSSSTALPSRPFAKIISTGRTVTVIDSVALVYQTITRTKPGGEPGGMKELLTLMQRNGQWKLIGRQTTKI
jgi:hypothetical protein